MTAVLFAAGPSAAWLNFVKPLRMRVMFFWQSVASRDVMHVWGARTAICVPPVRSEPRLLMLLRCAAVA
jgi:hypothetical protein